MAKPYDDSEYKNLQKEKIQDYVKKLTRFFYWDDYLMRNSTWTTECQNPPWYESGMALMMERDNISDRCCIYKNANLYHLKTNNTISIKTVVNNIHFMREKQFAKPRIWNLRGKNIESFARDKNSGKWNDGLYAVSSRPEETHPQSVMWVSAPFFSDSHTISPTIEPWFGFNPDVMTPDNEYYFKHMYDRAGYTIPTPEFYPNNFKSFEEWEAYVTGTGFYRYSIISDNDYKSGKFPTGQPYPENGVRVPFITLVNIPIFTNEEEANTYISNGDIGDSCSMIVYDYTLKEDVGLITVTPSEGGEDPDVTETESTGERKDNIENTELNDPRVNIAGMNNVRWYWLNRSQLSEILHHLWEGVDWSDALMDTFKNYYGNMVDCILSCQYIPIDKDSFFKKTAFTESPTFKIGRYSFTSETNVFPTLDNYPNNHKPIKLCEIKVKEYYKSFLDYSPYTDIFLYLPYYGMKKLDTNIFTNRSIVVKGCIDPPNGILTYMLFMKYKDKMALVDTINAQIGISLPLVLQDATSEKKRILESLTSIGLAGATTAINPMLGLGALASAGSNFNIQASPLQLNGSIGQLNGMFCDNIQVIIKRPNYNRPANYGKIYGFPTNLKKKLGACKGFTVVNDPQIRKFTHGTPTADEIEELLNILSNGIVIK